MSYLALVRNTIEKNFYPMTNLGNKNIEKFFSNDNMRIWLSAFTHETYSEDNYNNLKFIGDRILETMISKIICYKYPDLDEGQLSQMKSYYVDGNKYFNLALKYGLDMLIRTNGINKRQKQLLAGDVFESIFGALMVVSDTLGNGVGYIVCEKVVTYFFYDEITLSQRIYGPDKTIVVQILDKLTGVKGHEYFSVIPEEGKDVMRNYCLFIKDDVLKKIVNYTGINLYKSGFLNNNGSLVCVSNTSIREAEKYIYAKLVKKFEEIGLTRNSMLAFKFDKELKNVIKHFNNSGKNGEDMIRKIKKRMQKDGFERLEIKNPGKSKKDNTSRLKTLVLYGIYYTENGLLEKKIPILVKENPDEKNKNAVKIYLYESYANGKRDIQ